MPHKLPYHEYLHTKLARHAERILKRLYPDDPARREAFLNAIVAQEARMPAIYWMDQPPAERPFQTKRVADWQPDWVDVLTQIEVDAPSHNQLYFDGAFYSLDFSSVAEASALLAIKEPVKTILDVCSAPGGKGIFAWRLFKPETLICNEVIYKRHASLKSNLERCHVPAEVIQMDPKQLPSRYDQQCDLVQVDAPCSGQSLIARGLEASGAFQDHMINANMSRQRRILAESAPCVKIGGHLAYSTCTYGREENEKNVEWFLRTFPEFKATEAPHLDRHRSTLTDPACYRFEPQEGVGAGGFVALFQRTA
jgi:16S rRNA C967 or C1407 C5-methylase (RsmB/RsmF family)